MAIKQFDKSNLKQLRADIDMALNQVMLKHGINLSIGSITFDSGRFTTKLTGKVEISDENKSLIRNPIFEMYGFNIGDSFTHNTKTFVVVGYNSRSKKNAVELIDEEGKRFSTTINMVASKFKQDT